MSSTKIIKHKISYTGNDVQEFEKFKRQLARLANVEMLDNSQMGEPVCLIILPSRFFSDYMPFYAKFRTVIRVEKYIDPDVPVEDESVVGKIRILYVEEYAPLCNDMKRYLENEFSNVHVDTAFDAGQAIGLMKEKFPDILIAQVFVPYGTASEELEAKSDPNMMVTGARLARYFRQLEADQPSGKKRVVCLYDTLNHRINLGQIYFLGTDHFDKVRRISGERVHCWQEVPDVIAYLLKRSQVLGLQVRDI